MPADARRRPQQRTALHAALGGATCGALLWALGCNAILGFDPAEEQTATTGAGGSGASAGSGGMAGAGAVGGAGGSAGADGRPTILWSHAFGDVQTDLAMALALTPTQELVVGGAFCGSFDIAPGATIASAGQQDIYLSWFDLDGVHQRTNTYGDELGPQRTEALAVGPNGQLNAVFTFAHNLALDPIGSSPLVGDLPNDVAIGRWNSQGSHQWSLEFGGSGSERPSRIAADADGGLVHVGSFFDTTDFGSGPVASLGETDGYVVKLDSSGSMAWHHVLATGAADNDAIRDVVTDGDANIVLVAQFSGPTAFAGSALIHQDRADVLVAKLRTDGAVMWWRTFVGPGMDRAWAVSQAPDGHLYVVGDFANTLSVAELDISTDKDADLFVIKLTAEGDVVWARSYTGDDVQVPQAAATDRAGNLLITGYSYGDIDFGGGPRAHYADEDIFVVKLSPDGDHIWSELYASAQDDRGNAVAVDASGCVYVAGTFWQAIDLSETHVAEGDKDVFIAKFAP